MLSRLALLTECLSRTHTVKQLADISSARRNTRLLSQSASMQKARVAVLFQELDTPIISGVQKPRKPGGYQDSGADIAYVLQRAGVQVITPIEHPEPTSETGWCFPDTDKGIISAVAAGATHLWANTVLFASHPLQTSLALTDHETSIRVVGQPPKLVDRYDDKAWLNDMIRKHTNHPMPSAWTVSSDQDIDSFISSSELTFPIVAKAVRGRGSHGVKLCKDATILKSHLTHLFSESPLALIEQYMSGQEGTVTVLPPSGDSPDYISLPLVVRFNHAEGIAPYNGVVAVTRNSRAISQYEMEQSYTYKTVVTQCEEVAKFLRCTAPIRIDVRQFTEDPSSPFALFDINMKPNMTGPGRPGREDQASLTGMAAERIGWDYATLLKEILATAQTLQKLRQADTSIE